jgi:hypothetical protein
MGFSFQLPRDFIGFGLFGRIADWAQSGGVMLPLQAPLEASVSIPGPSQDEIDAGFADHLGQSCSLAGVVQAQTGQQIGREAQIVFRVPVRPRKVQEIARHIGLL